MRELTIALQTEFREIPRLTKKTFFSVSGYYFSAKFVYIERKIPEYDKLNFTIRELTVFRADSAATFSVPKLEK